MRWEEAIDSSDLLSKYLRVLEFRFDPLLLSNSAKNTLTRATLNGHVGRMWPAGRRFYIRDLHRRLPRNQTLHFDFHNWNVEN